MTSLCVVQRCALKSKRMFRSPKNIEILKLWQQALKIDHKEDNFLICEEHFEERFLKVETKLLPGAFPSLYLTNPASTTSEICQSCCKEFNKNKASEPRLAISQTFLEKFKDIMGFGLPDGVVCLACYEQTQAFHSFRTRAKKVHDALDSFKNSKPSSDPRKFIPLKVNNQKVPNLVANASDEVKIKIEPMEQEIITDNNKIIENPTKRGIFVRTMDGKNINKTQFSKFIQQKQQLPFQPPKSEVKTYQKCLKCHHCPSTFANRSLLTVHVREQHTFTCLECKRIFRFKTHLYNHWVADHGRAPPDIEIFKCTKCPMTFLTKELKEKHVNLVHLEDDAIDKTFKVSSSTVEAATPKVTVAEMTNQKKTLLPYRPSGSSPASQEVKIIANTSPQLKSITTNRVIRVLPAPALIQKANVKTGFQNVQPRPYTIVKRNPEGQLQMQTIKVLERVTPKDIPSPSLKTAPIKTYSKLPFKIMTHTDPSPTEPVVKPVVVTPKPPPKSFSVQEKRILARIEEREAMLRPTMPTIKEDPNGIPCLDCGLRFSPNNLLEHRRRFHDNSELNKVVYTCDLCGMELLGMVLLSSHMLSKHKSVYSYRCEICHQLFKSHFDVIKHQRVTHRHSLGKRKAEVMSFKNYSRSPKFFKSYEPKSEEYKEKLSPTAKEKLVKMKNCYVKLNKVEVPADVVEEPEIKIEHIELKPEVERPEIKLEKIDIEPDINIKEIDLFGGEKITEKTENEQIEKIEEIFVNFEDTNSMMMCKEEV